MYTKVKKNNKMVTTIQVVVTENHKSLQD